MGVKTGPVVDMQLMRIAEEMDTLQLNKLQMRLVINYLLTGKKGVRFRGEFDKPRVKHAIRLMQSLSIGNVTRLRVVLGVHAFADIADYEPYIEGRVTMEQLRQAGIDTRAVQQATRCKTEHYDKEGNLTRVVTTNTVRLYNSKDAIVALLPSEADVDTKIERPTVHIETVNMLRDQMALAAQRPLVPGLPALPPLDMEILDPGGGSCANASAEAEAGQVGVSQPPPAPADEET